MSVRGIVPTIIHAGDLREICAKFVPRVLWEDQKERRCHDSWEMVEPINLDPAVLDALVTCDESWIYCYDPETKRQSSQWMHAGSPRPKKARQSKSTHKLLMIPLFDSTGMIYMRWVPTGQTRNTKLRFLREFRKRFCQKWPALFKSGQWHFPAGQCTSPQLHPCHRLLDPRQFLSLPIVQTLAPYNFCLFPKLRKTLEAVQDNWGDEKGCDECHWHAHARGIR